jgi:lipopolysaccharide/colanic/teichoic acid biosynthesis glycosyltransferase
VRNYRALVVDIGWVCLSPYAALLVRDNFFFYEPHWDAIIPYSAFTAVAGTVVFLGLGPHKTLYRYASLSDLLRIAAAVTLTIFLAVSLSFVSSRLEGVARSIPVIQWLILVGGLIWTRVLARIWHNFRRRGNVVRKDTVAEHVLVIGVNQLTELYLESLSEYGTRRLEVVGILSERQNLRGRILRSQKILGSPEELSQVLVQLEVHGIGVSRIVVMESFERLSRPARSAILAVERDSDMRVDWLQERLGLIDEGVRQKGEEFETDPSRISSKITSLKNQHVSIEGLTLGQYGYVKRAVDIGLAMLLAVALAPLFTAIALLVVIDVGVPIVFWQKRPGRFGHPFKLYKFRTMRGPHDPEGKRLPNELRSSKIGLMLRRMRLDEAPQLYNVLVGEMSFVGPRPLLPMDQPDDISSRLAVRPGLTGVAQVYGDRSMVPNDKNALDIWYIKRASFQLDIKIMLRTALVFVRGERVDEKKLVKARRAIRQLNRQHAGGPLISSVVGNPQIEIALSGELSN